MGDSRRDFIRKSAAITALSSVGLQENAVATFGTLHVRNPGRYAASFCAFHVPPVWNNPTGRSGL
jgi:hypothetical protein